MVVVGFELVLVGPDGVVVLVMLVAVVVGVPLDIFSIVR